MRKKQEQNVDKEKFDDVIKQDIQEQDEIDDAQMSVDYDPNNLCLKSYKFSNIHELIKKARMVFGYTQEEFCKKIKVNRSTYSRYENGERQIPNKIVDKIFEVLDLKMIIQSKDIMDEIEEVEREARLEHLRKIFGDKI